MGLHSNQHHPSNDVVPTLAFKKINTGQFDNYVLLLRRLIQECYSKKN
jgi:hypothetical protein